MLRFLFRCPSCSGATDARAFPLCSACLRALVRAPALCRFCADPACPAASEPTEKCIRPWVSIDEISFESLTASYVSIGPGHSVLKSWKKLGGPAFDRRVLVPDARLRAVWTGLGPLTLIPMPQELRRSWSLGRSPADRLARWIAAETGGVVVRGLSIAPRRRGALRQAERSLEARLTEPPRFFVTSAFQGARCLVVDDFLTSGRTLRAAARALASAGAREVHGYVLGVRPRLQAGDSGAGAGS